MPPTLKTILLLALAVGAAAVAVQAVRSGVVRWRGGSVAATRDGEPGLFWTLVTAYGLVALVIAASAF